MADDFQSSVQYGRLHICLLNCFNSAFIHLSLIKANYLSCVHAFKEADAVGSKRSLSPKCYGHGLGL